MYPAVGVQKVVEEYLFGVMLTVNGVPSILAEVKHKNLSKLLVCSFQNGSN